MQIITPGFQDKVLPVFNSKDGMNRYLRIGVCHKMSPQWGFGLCFMNLFATKMPPLQGYGKFWAHFFYQNIASMRLSNMYVFVIFYQKVRPYMAVQFKIINIVQQILLHSFQPALLLIVVFTAFCQPLDKPVLFSSSMSGSKVLSICHCC